MCSSLLKFCDIVKFWGVTVQSDRKAFALCRLKKSGVKDPQHVSICTGCVCPVLEYAAPVSVNLSPSERCSQLCLRFARKLLKSSYRDWLLHTREGFTGRQARNSNMWRVQDAELRDTGDRSFPTWTEFQTTTMSEVYGISDYGKYWITASFYHFCNSVLKAHSFFILLLLQNFLKTFL